MRRAGKITAVVLIAVGGLSGCSSEEKTGRVSGEIIDATMNTLTLVTGQGDTLSFGTLDAEREAPDGILLGDTATVYFHGEVSGDRMLPAFRLTVSPASRPGKEGPEEAAD